MSMVSALFTKLLLSLQVSQKLGYLFGMDSCQGSGSYIVLRSLAAISVVPGPVCLRVVYGLSTGCLGVGYGLATVWLRFFPKLTPKQAVTNPSSIRRYSGEGQTEIGNGYNFCSRSYWKYPSFILFRKRIKASENVNDFRRSW